MFAIILQDKSNNEVERVSLEGSEFYLQKNDESSFPYLSELTGSGYDVFAQEDMGAIVDELKVVRSSLTKNSDLMHVDEIIRLATTCKVSCGYKLCFTPFSK